MVDNSLSPHGGKLVERVLPPAQAAHVTHGLPAIPIRDQIARECLGIAYGFFSPLEGFLGAADLRSVTAEMRLANGYVWSMPIVFDLAEEEIKRFGVKEGKTVLLLYQDQPYATLEVEEVYSYDKEALARQVYGTSDERHPGVRRTYSYKDRFVGGKVNLLRPLVVHPPFTPFWYTPRELRAEIARRGWKRVVAHQTRNVPHTGHEWLMKGAYFAANADGILVSAVIGEKRPGDYIDEAIVLAHDRLRETGYFRPEIHLTSILLWDMRYAGPREAVFHALVRKNLGCTHHMFGRDHAGVGTYYSPYAAHEVFAQLPDLGIQPVLAREWYYCPLCAGIASEELCGHKEQAQQFSGTLIRGILQDGVKPTRLIFRPEVFDVVMECAERYGFGSAFVAERYLRDRNPVFSLASKEVSRPSP
ncbi:MAG: sulfate adenylyltransferase [Dehalococcoidia bacterium]|nr:sulfate adenylyltransferase [Dehalococcoidia bacterium]